MSNTIIGKTEQHMGGRNSQHDLISVLHHLLEGVDSCRRYIKDAEGDSDSELAEFFEKVNSQNCGLAEEAAVLLKDRM